MSTVANSNTLTLFAEGKAVVVVSRNDDRIVLTEQEAVHACRAWSESARFHMQFADLLEHLSKWIEKHRHHISDASLSVRRSDLLFVVTQNTVEHNEELAILLPELDMEIANSPEFELIVLNVLRLPKVDESTATAFRSSGTIYTHADS